MYSIQTLNKISPCGLEVLQNADCTCADQTCEPDALLVRSFVLHDTELPASVKAIARAGAGVNNIPCDKCAEAGIVVFNTPGANANAVKELVVAALFLASRRICEAAAYTQANFKDDPDAEKKAEKVKSQFEGPEIKGKKLGIFGLGAIGAMVANDALALGMEVVGYDPYLTPAAAWMVDPRVRNAKSPDELYACDYLTIHVPLLPSTKGMIGKEAFSKMKKGLRLLNFARGELVDTQALGEAIADGTIARYLCDFASPEVLNMENVVALPHLGASTPEAEDNCAKMAAQQLLDFLNEGIIVNSVNFPTMDLPMTTPVRICVLHRKEEEILAKVGAALSETGVTAVGFSGKTRGNTGCVHIELNKASDELVKALEAIEAVSKVYVFQK